MDNTPFSKKCKVIAGLIDHPYTKEYMPNFTNRYDVACHYSAGVMCGDITINEHGMVYIEEAWEYLVEFLNADISLVYRGVEDLLENAAWETYNELLERLEREEKNKQGV